MELQLKDKVVFFAGASKGIGFAMARAFIQEGAKVALTASNAVAVVLAAYCG